MIKDIVVKISFASPDYAGAYAISPAAPFAALGAGAKSQKQRADAGLSAGAQVTTTTLSVAYDLFGRIARRFDLAVVGQDDPDKEPSELTVAEGALFVS